MPPKAKPVGPDKRQIKVAANAIVDVITNSDSTRQRLGRLINREGGIRDFDDECQYIADPTPQNFWDWYRNDPFARKVVNLMPRYSWQVQPLVYEDKDGEKSTAFEDAWDALGTQLKTEKSYRKQESGSAVWEYLQRLDELAGVGRYGVLFLGLDDLKKGEQPSKPADFKPGPNAVRKIMFMRAFPEHLAKITRYDQDLLSPRFGQPEMYSITMNDPSQTGTSLNGAPPQSTLDVHWTRVVHVAEGGEVLGVERMRAVHRNIQALQKIMAASPEGYWKACINILAVETNPQLGGDVDITDDDVKDAMEGLMEGLKRYALFRGTSLKAVGPAMTDPTPHIERQVEAICVEKDCPKRIFMGSERGELASSQDDDSWNDVVKARQVNWITMAIIEAFVDRLINLNVLPTPGDDGYTIEWPEVMSNTPKDKAEIALILTQALAAFTQSGANQLITPFDFFTGFLGMTDEDVENYMENAKKANDDTDESAGSPLLGLVGGVTGMIEMYTQAKAGTITEDQLRAMIKTFFKLPDEQIDELIAEGIEPAPPEPMMLPHGAKTGTDPNLPGTVVKLPKPPPPKPGKKPTANKRKKVPANA